MTNISFATSEMDNENEPYIIMDEEYLTEDEDVDDIELQNLLKKFGLFHDLYLFLKEKQIKVDALKFMKARHIDQIFNGEKTSSKIIFEHQLGLWQNERGVYYLKPQCSKNILPNNNIIRSEIITKEIPVKEILNQSIHGKELINSYKSNKILNPTDRTFIVHKIIQMYFENNYKLTTEVCKDIAKEIVELFPTETEETYFVKGSTKKSPKGKLWDRYQGRKRYMKSLSSSKRKPLEDRCEDNQNKMQSIPAMEEICVELKYIRDFEYITPKWRKTMDYRTTRIQYYTTSEILNDWPLYICPMYCGTLVNTDFQYLYPNKKFLYSKWEKWSENCESLLKERIKDYNNKHVLNTFMEVRHSMNTDNCNIYILKLLSAVLHPKTKVINGNHIKYTIQDSQAAFCVEIKNSNDFNNYLEVSQAEPFLLVYGDEYNFKNFFVVFNKVKFEFASFLETVDHSIKLFRLFNINFTARCELIWMFLSQFCYELDIPTTSPVLNTFIQDIHNTMK